MDKKEQGLNECPSCHAVSATTKLDASGAVYFYCTKEDCDFNIEQEKQDMHAAREKLEHIKRQLFNANNSD